MAVTFGSGKGKEGPKKGKVLPFALSSWILKFMQDRPTSGLSANDLQAALFREGHPAPSVREIVAALENLFKHKDLSKPFGNSPQPAGTVYQYSNVTIRESKAKEPPPSQTLRDVVLHNKKLLHDYGSRFQEIFGVSLVRWMDTVTGFDIIKFDDQVIKSGDKQMAQVVKDKYGQEAVDLIMTLIESEKK